MSKKYIIALDQGTSSSRAIVFDQQLDIYGVAQTEFTQIYPKPGWVEHDPVEIWASQSGVLTEVIARTGIKPSEIDAIGITNQRETTIVWDKLTGKPIYNAIVWQCRRTADACIRLEKQGYKPLIKEKTGLVLDAYFSATKIQWILDHVAGAREKADRGELMFGTVDSWLVYNLSDKHVHVTDVTNASRTMLFNIHTLTWDLELCALFNIPQSMLPTVCDSSKIYATTNIQGVHIPIAGIAGDQQAALFGQTCFEVGQAKNTYGTGCFLLMNTGSTPIESQHGLISTIAIGLNNHVQYALEGSIFVAGALIQWLRDSLNIIQDTNDSEYFATKVTDNNGVYLVPAFTGLGAPYWDMYARGSISGLTRGSTKNHIIRAALEAIAYQTYDVVVAMEEDCGTSLDTLRVDGGASSNRFLMQFQSDILNRPVQRPLIKESTAMGAVMLAGLATGFFKSKDELKQLVSIAQQYSPEMDEKKRQLYLKGWHKAVERSMDWEEKD